MNQTIVIRKYLAYFISFIGIFFVYDAALVNADNTNKGSLIYVLEAKNATLIHKVIGDVTSSLNGVPAEPVDSFVWNGDGLMSVKGKASFKIDPKLNSGEIHAEWKDKYGNWTYDQVMFKPPNHPTGARIGRTLNATELVVGDPITTNVYLHGDTKAGGPVLPTMFNLIATWGPVKITLNGAPFDNPYDGPLPMWIGHTMTAVGVRNDKGSVRTISGDIFNMSKASEGKVNVDELEFHLVFHDAPGPEMTANVPPPLSFFYHLTFSDVKLKLKQKDR